MIIVVVSLGCAVVGGVIGWALRTAVFEMGECAMCDRRRQRPSAFCADHIKTAAKVAKTLGRTP